jgi:hypothetical protein
MNLLNAKIKIPYAMTLSFSKTLLLVTILLIAGCKEQTAFEKYNCKLLETEEMGTAKKSIYIQIPEQLTEMQIKEIAMQMRNEHSAYERLFIFYLLPEMRMGAGAWATSHFNTELEINILGVGSDAEEAMKNPDIPEGEVIGEWYDRTLYIEHSVVIYKLNGDYKLKEVYADGNSIIKDLKFVEVDGKSKFIYDNDFGEYFLIENDGRLGLYDPEGLVSMSEIIE